MTGCPGRTALFACTAALGLACGRVRVDHGAMGAPADALAPSRAEAASVAMVADVAMADAGTEAPPDAAPSLEPLPPQPLFAALPVPGFPDAVVSVPNGATSVRPVVVVIHGSGDRPDWNCDAWRHITSAHGFVLCPRGAHNAAESTKDDERFTHRGGETLRRHIDAALDALVARWQGYVDPEHPIVTGFSLGATEIAQLAIAQPSRFPRVAVLEGGHDVWTAQAAKAFADGGGRRVFFGCGSRWCTPAARAAAARLAKAAVEARVVFADVGHTNDRPLQEAIMTELAWFFDGDPRWAQ